MIAGVSNSIIDGKGAEKRKKSYICPLLKNIFKELEHEQSPYLKKKTKNNLKTRTTQHKESYFASRRPFSAYLI